ncbi:phosphorylase family protein [Saccharopolyspora shandongensis]|uniref:5'-methylthioadenosine/S-adenosylhomocysteine nucleosidase family protein n=1 Tax=Saccharopolyspora shandongensis TaxID=418495 RepID=UPI0033D224F3
MICTALAEEYNMVREHLNEPLSEWEERGTLYELGTIRGVSGVWTVALVETGVGNTTAGIELERAASVFAPDVVLFVGVAGGRKDVALGDVVAGDAVYDFESGKDTENCYLPRIKTQPSSHRLVQRAKAVARRGRWHQRTQPACPVSPPNAVVR